MRLKALLLLIEVLSRFMPADEPNVVQTNPAPVDEDQDPLGQCEAYPSSIPGLLQRIPQRLTEPKLVPLDIFHPATQCPISSLLIREQHRQMCFVSDVTAQAFEESVNTPLKRLIDPTSHCLVGMDETFMKAFELLCLADDAPKNNSTDVSTSAHTAALMPIAANTTNATTSTGDSSPFTMARLILLLVAFNYATLYLVNIFFQLASSFAPDYVLKALQTLIGIVLITYVLARSNQSLSGFVATSLVSTQ